MSDDDLMEKTEKIMDRLNEMEDSVGPEKEFSAWGHVDSVIEDVVGDVDTETRQDLRENVENWLRDSEMEPSAVVMLNGDKRREITPYEHPEGFDADWHSTDAWRGYFNTKTSDEWKNVFSDTILSMHYTEKKLKRLQESLRERFSMENINFAEVYPRTSNVFATGFDIFVRGEDLDRAEGEVLKAKEEAGLDLSEKERKLKEKLNKEMV